MFLCEFCNKSTKLYEKLHRQVTKVRIKTYANESFGTETVEEKRACSACYLSAAEVEPIVVDNDPLLNT